MNYAVILAGGSGSRFWPLSRELQPKQFLSICSVRPMIEEVIIRISPLIRKENIYVATSSIYAQKIKKCLKKFNIPLANILLEAQSKNTFAPIAVLSNKINNFDSEAVVAILPSDHFIKNRKRFLKFLRKGIETAKNGFIVSLGISPDRPETGYGYIKIKSKIRNSCPPHRQACLAGRQEKLKLYNVDKFIEKPGLLKARKFMRDKRYYWNSGMFVFRPRVILGEVRKFMPALHKSLMQIEKEKDCFRIWHKFPSISVDYAIMEKTKKMALLPLDCGWMDLGSWEAVAGLAKKDKNGNFFRGRYLDIGSKSSFVWADKRLIATLGLDNIIIVDSQDALLVCRSDMSQDVKKIVGLLKQKNFKGQI